MKFSAVFIALMLIYGRIFGQTFVDRIILISGDTIVCTITLINDQNIFYKEGSKKSKKNSHVLLESVSTYSWVSRDIQSGSNSKKYVFPFDSINSWNFGIKFTNQFNYPIVHSAPALSLYKKHHNFSFGPEFTNLRDYSFGNPLDPLNLDQQKYWGLNAAYRYILDSNWKKTNVFFQMNFSLYQLFYTEDRIVNDIKYKETIVENTIGIGVNHQLFPHLEIFGGIGFGSTNGFFLMLEQFIPHSLIGIEFKLKR
ncbi:MAG: hypothetical protein IPN36_11585 [Bacteroidetes bacterium]|nr:hypothetical protein [Bacteroidota bacterium]